jgi:hypothetical protein
MIYDLLRNGVVPVTAGQLLRLVGSGALGRYGYMEACCVRRAKVIDASAAATMHMSQAQAECAVGTLWVEYSKGHEADGDLSSHFWPRSLRSLVERPAGGRVLFGKWRNEVPDKGRAVLMALDVPEELHRAVSERSRATTEALFAMLPMQERIEVVDESQSTSQRTLTVYFDGKPVEVVDNTRRWGEELDPQLGFAARSVEQACLALKTWFVQRNLKFTSDVPMHSQQWKQGFDATRASLTQQERFEVRAREEARSRQALLDRCQEEDSLVGTPRLTRDLERQRA